MLRIVRDHAERGITLQLWVRGLLVVFAIGTLLLLPPVTGAGLCFGIAGGYALAVLLLTGWLQRRGPAAVEWGWLGLYVDLVALSALCVVTDESADLSWTSYVLLNGFFLLPILAATQLRWGVCASVVVPTVVFYFIEGLVTQEANEEPTASIVLRTLVLAGVGVAAIGLSRIQRSRVTAIAGLVADRSTLLTELLTTTDTEHRKMAENLHDGALQFILAARMDLEDARELADPAAFDRLDQALTQSSQLLRSTVGELHPAVLKQSGLAAALSQLARTAAERSGLTLTLDTTLWPETVRTPNDLLLFGTARELLANVTKHAQATALNVELKLRAGQADLTIADNGVGSDPEVIAKRVREGHIGLESQRVKVEAAGGEFVIDSPPSGGTTVHVVVPAPGTV